MWKIYKSLFTILVVSVAAAGVSYAYFSDVETSSGNTFAAGAIDLKIDHTKQTYNDIDCKTCSVSIVSDTDNLVIAEDGVAITPHDAFLAPTAGDWTTLAGANWIWGTAGHPADDDRTEYTFENTFTWYGPVQDVTLDLTLTGDDNYQVFVNGQFVGGENTGTVWQNIYSYTNFASALVQGQNKITFVVKNSKGSWAGLLYKLTIDGQCGDNYFRTHCSLWDEKNLGVGDTFFNFDDVKPGDRGVNVISLHPDSNDAWACLNTANEQDLENTNITPEQDAGDTSSPAGELSHFLKVFAWWDTNANGVFDSGEGVIGTTDFGTLGTLPLADVTTGGGALPGGQVKHLGLFWCAGTLIPPVAGNPFSCDGSNMGNTAQTDSYSTDVKFYAIQQRGNAQFTCSSLESIPVDRP